MTNSFICHRSCYLIARLLLGGIFLYAAILKMYSPFEFTDEIAAYQLLPVGAINFLALGLPFFELTCGLLLLTGFHIRIGAIGIFTLLLVFTGAIVMAIKNGLSIDCGCFGGHSWFESNLWAAIGRNGVLFLLIIFIYRQSLLNEPEQRQTADA